MKLEISGGQLNNLRKGKAINLSNAQLNGQNKKGKAHEVDVDDGKMKAMDSARRRGKGYRISGGDIFGSISKGVKTASKTASKTVSDSVSDLVSGKSSSKWAKGKKIGCCCCRYSGRCG
jgi:hypothetical protein